MHDVFISYEHESKAIADNICAALESSKIRCFYAPRDIQGDYATSIVDAIQKSKVFILVLNELASNSMHVLNEVEQAHEKLRKREDMFILPFKMDDESLSQAMCYYVKRLHWIDATNNSTESAIAELKKQVMTILKITADEVVAENGSARISNKYFSNDDKKEVRRLKQQLEVLKKFDQDIYDKCASGTALTVLDVGTNDGSFIIDRLANNESIDRIIGLEYDAVTANEHCKQHPKYKSYHCDVEDDEFTDNLEEIMVENDIDKFDIINVSMLLLHVKSPQKLIKNLRKYLKPQGQIIVKDIDDGLNMAYPDDNKWFDKIYEICDQNGTSGYRKTGRQIFSFLQKSGYKDIHLEAQGLNTIGMNYDEKQACFDVYFSFILEDLKIMINKYPNDKSIAEKYTWYKDIYDDLEEHFHRDDFMFSLGFVLYTATK